jgi:hypothetical protein
MFCHCLVECSVIVSWKISKGVEFLNISLTCLLILSIAEKPVGDSKFGGGFSVALHLKFLLCV